MEPADSTGQPDDQADKAGPSAYPPLWRNWISLLGIMLVLAACFSFVLLLVSDVASASRNPYVGVLAYLVAPGIGGFGLALIIAGILVERRLLRRLAPGAPLPVISIDTSRRSDRRKIALFGCGIVLILLVSALGSYRTYQFTESVNFCGEVCHQVMKPEFTTYQHSPHARVTCTECHIGTGAEWWVKAKISGLYQVYATARGIYQRPIKTPIRNLRPAQETCEHCHWPQKFIGNVERVYRHYLTDENNTPYTVRLLLKVGGGDPTAGPVGGIHWHMSVANKVEYIATDARRQVIPWVRVTNPEGKVTVYKTKDFKDDPARHEIRRMDCMDCHNRPSHIFKSPGEALDVSLSLGRLDPKMPNIKAEAVDLLMPHESYSTERQALDTIAATLARKYPKDARVAGAIAEVQRIYRDNFFPEMKSNWQAYPVNIGHKEWPGCFRCHDGEHKSVEGGSMIKSDDCNTCHLILAQGKKSGDELVQPTPLKFKHPGGSMEDQTCVDCHGSSGGEKKS